VSTIALTLLALFAFAANSLLCRLALAEQAIDATSFTAIRLASGAAVLLVLVERTRGHVTVQRLALQRPRWRDLWPPLALFLYALPFSLAYVRIGAATGALILFGAVQFTLLAVALRRGERPRARAWLGFVLALGGFAWLCGPSASRPDLLGVVLMAGAGVAWAAYTLLGRGGLDPLVANAHAFAWSSLPALMALAAAPDLSVSGRGVLLATLSGTLASALGYAVWYRVLPRLAVATAAFAQLTVPVIAALGAVLLLGEEPTTRLGVASALVLGGVALAVADRLGGER
jgi:drug/metabolite transporter (DMT)-like permease